LCSRTASWALSTREAHFSSRDRLSGVCTQVCGSRIGDDRGMSNGRRSFHATGTKHMAGQNFNETSRLQNAEEFKAAYLKLATEWFIDTNKITEEAKKKFEEIQQAYEALNDDEKRALHGQVFSRALTEPRGYRRFYNSIVDITVGDLVCQVLVVTVIYKLLTL